MQPKLATRDGRPVHQVQKVSFLSQTPLINPETPFT
jgi:hypothetical protein